VKNNTYNVSRDIDLGSAFPLSILKNRKLAVLESIVKYLKEERKLYLHQIAQILNRNDRTIWTVYSRAKQKVKTNKKTQHENFIPLSMLRDRSVSVFEAIVEYLIEVRGLSYQAIAELTNRNPRTIWTIYSRVRKKRVDQFK